MITLADYYYYQKYILTTPDAELRSDYRKCMVIGLTAAFAVCWSRKYNTHPGKIMKRALLLGLPAGSFQAAYFGTEKLDRKLISKIG